MNEREFKQNHTNLKSMRKMNQPLKNIELRIVAELMKNSRRSDRQLAKVIGVSQPTVTRIRGKLEKSGVIREYTMIPDFTRLGYSVMGATLLDLQSPLGKEQFPEVQKVSAKIEASEPYAALIAVNGLSKDKNRLFIALYKNYSDYVNAMRLVRQVPLVNIDNIESLLVDLNDETNYRVLSLSALAHHLLESLKRKENNE
jgi:DNA-binding Lrp family transcriptional regulator